MTDEFFVSFIDIRLSTFDVTHEYRSKCEDEFEYIVFLKQRAVVD